MDVSLNQKIEDNWIELGLEKSSPATTTHANAEVAEHLGRLIEVISDSAIESEDLNTGEFRSQLERYRGWLASGEENGQTLESTLRSTLKACEDYFRRARQYLFDRESEFAEVIEVLRSALNQVTGESQAFNKKMIDSSDRFRRLADVDDLRELKRQIVVEVTDMKRTVEEKQKQDLLTFTKLNSRIEHLQVSLKKANEEALLDPLTRVSNRGGFEQALRRWSSLGKERNQPFLVAMLDIDDFKKINDTFGHPIGDRVLVCASQWFARYVRASDLLARYGGEEFAILMSDFKLPQAEAKFADLLSKIAGFHYEFEINGERRRVSFTVSCGLAECAPGEKAEDAVHRADQALYEAKRRGKNRVIVKRRSVFSSLFKSRESDRPAVN